MRWLITVFTSYFGLISFRLTIIVALADGLTNATRSIIVFVLVSEFFFSSFLVFSYSTIIALAVEWIDDARLIIIIPFLFLFVVLFGTDFGYFVTAMLFLLSGVGISYPCLPSLNPF
jgi:hypothetical protein